MESRAMARDGRVPLWARRNLAIALAIAGALLLASCGAEEDQQGDGGGAEGEGKAGETAGKKGPEAGLTRAAERVTVEELAANPGEFYGDSVTVAGEVIEAVEPGAFRIENDGSRLLVVGVEEIPKIVDGDTKGVNEGDLIKATGEARRFQKEEVQQDADHGTDDEYFEDFEGDPAVMAYSVKILP